MRIINQTGVTQSQLDTIITLTDSGIAPGLWPVVRAVGLDFWSLYHDVPSRNFLVENLRWEYASQLLVEIRKADENAEKADRAI